MGIKISVPIFCLKQRTRGGAFFCPKQIIIEVPEATVPTEYEPEEKVLGRIAYEDAPAALQKLPLIIVPAPLKGV